MYILLLHYYIYNCNCKISRRDENVITSIENQSLVKKYTQGICTQIHNTQIEKYSQMYYVLDSSYIYHTTNQNPFILLILKARANSTLNFVKQN